MLRISAAIIITAFFISPALIIAENINKGDKNHIKMSRKFHRILSAEMNIIQNSMNALAIAIPSGNWEEIAVTAKNMTERNIINNKLTKEERITFDNSFPDGYREIEHDFFKSADMLSDAAEKHNVQFVSLFYSKLNENCILCHSRYSEDRFPGFKDVPVIHED